MSKLLKTLKGKTKVGKALDGVFEWLPFPNPIRFAKEREDSKTIKKLLADQVIKNKAISMGIDINEMLEDGPSWLTPVISILSFAAVVYLLATGAITLDQLSDFISNLGTETP